MRIRDIPSGIELFCQIKAWTPGSSIVNRDRVDSLISKVCGTTLNFLMFAPISSVNGGETASTSMSNPEVHVERVVTLVKQLLQLFIVANDDSYALAA